QEGACILPTIEGTRHHFDELEKKLIGSLVSEKLGGVLRELSAKALYIVDLVVRNLYERTADVAFLATDRELRHGAGLQHAGRGVHRPADGRSAGSQSVRAGQRLPLVGAFARPACS